MTSNQIEYQKHLETIRSNMTNERERERSNLANETELKRSNLAKEGETQRSNLARETEDKRYHTESLAETKRHNLFGEQLEQNKLEETRRSNQVRETETHRSNLANESNSSIQASAAYLGSQASAIQATTAANRLAAEKPLISARVGSETAKTINFGSEYKLNQARTNEANARAALARSQKKTEDRTRLPKIISGYTGIVGNLVNTALSGAKLFGG